MTTEPTPEVKAALREFCRIQREKYGPDWKRILSAKMAKASEPYVKAIMPIRLTPTHTHASILLLKQGRPI